MHCCTLQSACIDVHPNPDVWRQWRGEIPRRRMQRPFTLHVARESEAELKCMLPRIKEPLNPTQLRHLEKDVVSMNVTDMLQRRWGGKSLTMLWPLWENGYGDVLADTLLPLADLSRRHMITNDPIAVSGIENNNIIEQLRSFYPGRMCASERVMDGQKWERCQSACFSEIRVCHISHRDVHEAWETRAFVDTAMGWRNRLTERAAWQEMSKVRVVFVSRQPHGAHHRRIMNEDSLLKSCNAATFHDTRLVCSLVSAGMQMGKKVNLLQTADVMVSGWGGDTIHALHLRRNAAVIEIVNELFATEGPQSWVRQHKRWITRSLGQDASNGKITYHSLRNAFNNTIIGFEEHACLQRAQKKSTAKWQCVWNADMFVDWNALRKSICAIAQKKIGVGVVRR